MKTYSAINFQSRDYLNISDAVVTMNCDQGQLKQVRPGKVNKCCNEVRKKLTVDIIIQQGLNDLISHVFIKKKNK